MNVKETNEKKRLSRQKPKDILLEKENLILQGLEINPWVVVQLDFQGAQESCLLRKRPEAMVFSKRLRWSIGFGPQSTSNLILGR